MSENKLFSPESEEAVLSLILKNPQLFHNTGGVRSHMFSATPYVNLYAEMEYLTLKQLEPDPALIVPSLEAKNQLDSVGGKHNIQKLMSKEYKEDNFSEYCDILVKSYMGRSLMAMVSGVKKEALNTETLPDTISSLRRGLDDLIGMRGGADTVHVSDLAMDVFNDIIARRESPGIRGVTWGVASIDTVTGGKSPGDLVIVAGRPGAGKSSVVCNSVWADAMAGKGSLIISREMKPKDLFERLISIDTGIPSTNIRLGVLNQEQINEIRDSAARIKKLPIYLDGNFRTNDVYYFESIINRLKKRYDISNVYLDYLQIVADRDEHQTMEIGRYTRLFKLMAEELNICSILLSQLNRKVEERDDKRPMMSDMKQSGAIEEDADFVIGLYRDEYYHPETKAKGLMEYLILKNRNGPTGTVTVKFDAPTYRIMAA
jgi:replicative DNA helicase